MNNIIEYLKSKNINFSLEGKEAIVTCPNCAKNKLYINIETQVYHCFHCEALDPVSLFARGHFSKIQEYYGDIVPLAPMISTYSNTPVEDLDFTKMANRYNYNLSESKKGLRYLIKRGITQKAIDHFKLGFVRMYEQDWITIPSYENNICKLIKYRKCPPDENPDVEKYIREKGGKSILFNGDIIDKYDEIIVVEGELDCITLWLQGYENVVAVTAGCGTFKPEWYDNLVLKSKIITIFDNDDKGQGQKAARDIWSSRLGRDRCWNVLLPKGFDINSYFLEHSKEEFDKLLGKAERFKVKGILSFTEVLFKMFQSANEKGEEQRIVLPWSNMNRLTGGGIKKSWLITIGGIPGSGKTSFATQLAHYFAKEYNMPSLIFCMEMPEVSLGTKILQLEYDLVVDEIRFSDALVYLRELEDLPLYFGYSAKITPEIYYNTIKEAIHRYGIEFAVFDNLQYLVRSDKESDMSNASKLFKDVAMEFNIVHALISQPRKVNSERTITFDDLKGSSAIPADADQVYLLNRKRLNKEEGTLDPITDVLVDKSRWSAGGKTNLLLVGEKSKFVEMDSTQSINSNKGLI